MNGPAYGFSRRRPSDSEIDQLVDDFLAREARRDEALGSHGQSDLDRFLSRLGRRRRRLVLGRLARRIWLAARPRNPARPFAVPPIPDAREAHYAEAPRREGFPRLPAPRLLVWAIAAALLTAAAPYAAERLARPLVAKIEHPAVDQAEQSLLCGDAVILRDKAGALAGVARTSDSGRCGSVHLTAPFDDATALRVAEALGVLEGRWAASLLTFFGHDLIGFGRGVLNEIELRVRGIDRATAIARRNRGDSATNIEIAGSSPILSAFEAVVGQPNAIPGIATKLRNIGASMVFEARLLGGDRLARAHFLADRMTVLRIGGGRALAGAIGAELLFGGRPRDLGEICLFAAAAGFHLYQPFEGASDGSSVRRGVHGNAPTRSPLMMQSAARHVSSSTASCCRQRDCRR